MIEISKIDVWGFEHAIRGMRNPMNSWDKADSYYNVDGKGAMVLGDNDLELMRRLYKASLIGDNHAHRKFLRQIFVSMDINAPLYWWKEFDTYKVGTVANSCSTMHKIAAKEFELDDFSHEHLVDFHGDGEVSTMGVILNALNWSREKYLETKNKDYWWQMIQLLPSSYNQKRTVTMNYENVITIIMQRTGHKLDEWRDFVDVLCKLPYLDEITKEDK